jgi:tRNA/tmRNA/rRNA uracil-C5-methylase (TrmA/RlmC/RlmD family)
VTLAPGAVVDAEVERPVAGGRMLARHEGQVIFVDGAVPGELVEARISHRAGGAWFADVAAVRRASDDRVPDASDRSCGGLLYRHVRYPRQLLLKAEVLADAFRRIAKRPLDGLPVVRPSPADGYRLRARLHVEGGRAGFFREGTREWCAAGPTGQLRPDALTVVDAVLAGMQGSPAPPAWIAIAENVAGTARVVHVEPRDEHKPAHVAADIAGLPGLTGVTTSAHGRVVTVAGQPTVRDVIGDLAGVSIGPSEHEVAWTRHATSFFQSNRFLVGALLQAVLTAANGDRVVDLYAGVGLFSLALAARGASVVAVEGDRSSGADLSVNARPWQDRMLVVRGSVEEAVAGKPGSRPDVVILDPPRTGATPAALKGLTAWRAPRLVYVSCDPPTLARDAVRLFAAGYALTSIEAFDFFPHTAHVETVAVFDRG